MLDPTKVAQPDYAVLSAIWYWTSNNLNRFADADDIKGCTRAVNGKAMLGLEERVKFYEGLKQLWFKSKEKAVFNPPFSSIEN